jgi:hypothetical protein
MRGWGLRMTTPPPPPPPPPAAAAAPCPPWGCSGDTPRATPKGEGGPAGTAVGRTSRRLGVPPPPPARVGDTGGEGAPPRASPTTDRMADPSELLRCREPMGTPQAWATRGTAPTPGTHTMPAPPSLPFPPAPPLAPPAPPAPPPALMSPGVGVPRAWWGARGLPGRDPDPDPDPNPDPDPGAAKSRRTRGDGDRGTSDTTPSPLTVIARRMPPWGTARGVRPPLLPGTPGRGRLGGVACGVPDARCTH